MYYPKSFFKLLLIGFLLAALPLAYALGELYLRMERLTRQSQQAVLQAAQAGRASRQLFEQTTNLERIARQFLVLEDASLLEDYGKARAGFQQTAQQLAALPLDGGSRKALKELGEEEQHLQQQLSASHVTPGDAAAASTLVDGYSGFTEHAQAMLRTSDQFNEREIERLRETAEKGQARLLWLVLAATVIAVTIAVGFALLIARPIRQIDLAIRQMGRADFVHGIEVNGPQDLRYLGQRLEWLRLRLRDLEEQQNRFMRHVSHELKTPLTAVREGAELLHDRVGGELSPEQDEIVRIVRENTVHLQKLIEDLLNYQQNKSMEAHTMGPVALVDVIRRVIREHKLAAYARAITIQAKLKPLLIMADSEKIRIIVDNLLSNAIKYSPRGGEVRLELEQRDGYALLDVIDQGPGVSPDESEKIFESFYQGKSTSDGRVKGTGLGLAITREYVLAHGGRIAVVDGEGAERTGGHFRVELPLDESIKQGSVDAVV
jgi:two-component system sensor histidine kinase GlrK